MATRILFFGRLREAAGTSERLVNIPDAVLDLASLIEWLAGDDHALRETLAAPSTRIAVDQMLVQAGARLQSGKPPEEVAFMSPFSGG